MVRFTQRDAFDRRPFEELRVWLLSKLNFAFTGCFTKVTSAVQNRLSSIKAFRELRKHSRYCFQSFEFNALTGREEGRRAGKIALSRLHDDSGLVMPLARGLSGFLCVRLPLWKWSRYAKQTQDTATGIAVNS
ncbi:hypothetical protein JOE11_005315 [Robbsia andropogonis]